MSSKLFLPAVLFLLFCCAHPDRHFEIRDTSGMNWYRGNIHTHARECESDTSVDSVVNWYRNNGYQFLVITDHNVITFPPEYIMATDSFLLIPGEEITGFGNKIDVEINGLNIRTAILPLHADSVPGAYQKCIDAVRLQQGVPVFNHPNYKWRLNQSTILSCSNCNLFEVYNGFPGTFSEGDSIHPALEKVWDSLLSSGRRIYGVASDDAHSYTQFSVKVSNPGRGWVVVKSKSLEAREIMHNLDSGLFYSSTGVGIIDFIVQTAQIEIDIRESQNIEYTTDFIGSGGKLLFSTKKNPAIYKLSSEQHYVRARITDSEGHHAWLQPVFVVRKD
jgi:hypothetical protein